MRLVTIGTFDTPHMGHAAFLRRCSLLADTVIVGVLTDQFVAKYKGQAPYYSLHERKTQIARLGYHVDSCYDHASFIFKHRPDLIAVGSDWHGGQRYLDQLGVTQEELDGLDCGIVYFPYTPGISTTDLKRRLRANGDHR